MYHHSDNLLQYADCHKKPAVMRQSHTSTGILRGVPHVANRDKVSGAMGMPSPGNFVAVPGVLATSLNMVSSVLASRFDGCPRLAMVLVTSSMSSEYGPEKKNSFHIPQDVFVIQVI